MCIGGALPGSFVTAVISNSNHWLTFFILKVLHVWFPEVKMNVDRPRYHSERMRRSVWTPVEWLYKSLRAEMIWKQMCVRACVCVYDCTAAFAMFLTQEEKNNFMQKLSHKTHEPPSDHPTLTLTLPVVHINSDSLQFLESLSFMSGSASFRVLIIIWPSLPKVMYVKFSRHQYMTATAASYAAVPLVKYDYHMDDWLIRTNHLSIKSVRRRCNKIQ